jgi:hypothetical protein
MRVSFRQRQVAIREAHLAQEEELYSKLPFGTFRKIKDWDHEGPKVIWEGVVSSQDLHTDYKVQIHYGPVYPYKRPNVYPIKPRIENQRHQEPTKGRRDLPGALCLLPHNPDRWAVGLTCRDVIERTIVWLKAYENGTLDQELAPPEIERFFPPANLLGTPKILLVNSLLKNRAGESGTGCLLMPTKSGKFAFLYLLNQMETDGTIEELTRLLGLILPGETIAKNGWLTGNWFDLKCEPDLPVPLNSTGFLNLLTQHDREPETLLRIAREKPQVVAVRYPTDLGKHWLIFSSKFTYPARAGFRKAKFELKVREVNKVNQLKLYSSYHISPETIFRRVSGYEVEKLQNKSCVILGCGSIGSRLAETLIKSGVGTMHLVDNDELRAGNVSRHVLGLDYIGQNKADGMKHFLHKRNPDAKLAAFQWDILAAPQALSTLIESTDLTISCLGNDAAELFISGGALAAQKPALFCRSYLQGRLGQVLLYSPPLHCACFNCASKYIESASCPIPRIPPVDYRQSVGLDDDCGSAFIPASGIDLDLVSLHGAQIALEQLQETPITANYWLIRGRDFQPSEYPELAAELRGAFLRHPYTITADVSCENCRSFKPNEKRACA